MLPISSSNYQTKTAVVPNMKLSNRNKVHVLKLMAVGFNKI